MVSPALADEEAVQVCRRDIEGNDFVVKRGRDIGVEPKERQYILKVLLAKRMAASGEVSSLIASSFS